MITYFYRCTACHNEFEKMQSIKDVPIKDCPICFKQTCERVITGGAAPIIKVEPKTLGLLASRNADKFGRQYVQEKTHEIRQRGKEGRRFTGKMATGGTQIERPKDNKAWWRPGTDGPDNNLAKMDKKQTIDYIYKGKKPNVNKDRKTG